MQLLGAQEKALFKALFKALLRLYLRAKRLQLLGAQEKAMLEESMAQLKIDFGELTKNVEAERTALRAQVCP